MKKGGNWLIAFFLCCMLVSVAAAAEERTVVYVSDAGNDTSETAGAAAPLKTLQKAYSLLPNGGTIVVCGPLTLSGNALHLPESDSTVTITSAYDGVDYASTKGAILNLGGYTYLNGDTVFENIKIHDAGTYYFNQLICGGHDLTIGDGVICTKDSGEYITILGGMYISSAAVSAADVSFYDYTITIWILSLQL